VCYGRYVAVLRIGLDQLSFSVGKKSRNGQSTLPQNTDTPEGVILELAIVRYAKSQILKAPLNKVRINKQINTITFFSVT
jgi:hypothetical protein